MNTPMCPQPAPSRLPSPSRAGGDRNRGWTALATTALALLWLAGCGKPPAAPPPPAPEVEVLAIAPQQVVLTTELPGRTAPFLSAEVRPQVSGIIQKRLFTEGSVVKAGDVLYEIDPSSYRAAQRSAEAAVAVAKANQATAQAALGATRARRATALAALDAAKAAAEPLRLRVDRFRELVASKAISQQDFDDVSAALKEAQSGIASAEAAVLVAESDIQSAEAAILGASANRESAEASLETARINLGYTRITAPIAGRIGRSSVTDGALVTAHQPLVLATIQYLDSIYVDVPQSTVTLLRLRERLKNGSLDRDNATLKEVKLILPDGTSYPQVGSFQFREVTVDPTTASVTVRVLFPNPDGLLLPGMFVRAIVVEGVDREALLIPQEAVSRDAKGNPTALVVGPDGVAVLRVLTLDRALGNRWLVASGLAAGDRLIVGGMMKVRPGASVKIATPASPQPGTPAAPASPQPGAQP